MITVRVSCFVLLGRFSQSYLKERQCRRFTWLDKGILTHGRFNPSRPRSGQRLFRSRRYYATFSTKHDPSDFAFNDNTVRRRVSFY